uniref:Uncharacterized protein n=1 Tax=Panagrolaimus sp. JU765 TaxID=591449 RepID=A0AC34RG08_9BILA
MGNSNSTWSFCGEPLMKDGSVYNTSTIPNVSVCFQHTILVFVPCFFYWLLFPALLMQTKRSRNANRFLPLPISWLFGLKLVIAAILFFDSIFLFTRYFADNSDDLPTPGVNIVYPLILAITCVLLIFGHIVCKQAGIVSSGIIFNTWLLLTFCGLPELYEWIQKSTDEQESTSNGRNIGFYIWWFGCLIEAFLFCFADKRSNKEVPNAELDSSFLNRLTIQWFTRLPLIGAKKDLEIQDLFELNEGNTANYLENQWDHYWIPTMKKYNEKRKAMLAEAVVTKMNGKEPIHDKQTTPNKLEPPSVVYNLFKMFKYELITSFGIKICSDILQFANPYLLK